LYFDTSLKIAKEVRDTEGKIQLTKTFCTQRESDGAQGVKKSIWILTAVKICVQQVRGDRNAVERESDMMRNATLSILWWTVRSSVDTIKANLKIFKWCGAFVIAVNWI
jgi:hypothetical protein